VKNDSWANWKNVCRISEILPFSGVATLVRGDQVAIFRLRHENEVYAISNYDPFSRACVLSHGLVGDRSGILKVASPIFKHCFNLKTGECLDDPSIVLPTWDARVVAGIVQISVSRKSAGKGIALS
jgi:nitrite reductase (NADH) small subunit